MQNVLKANSKNSLFVVYTKTQKFRQTKVNSKVNTYKPIQLCLKVLFKCISMTLTSYADSWHKVVALAISLSRSLAAPKVLQTSSGRTLTAWRQASSWKQAQKQSRVIFHLSFWRHPLRLSICIIYCTCIIFVDTYLLTPLQLLN